MYPNQNHKTINRAATQRSSLPNGTLPYSSALHLRLRILLEQKRGNMQIGLEHHPGIPEVELDFLPGRSELVFRARGNFESHRFVRSDTLVVGTAHFHERDAVTKNGKDSKRKGKNMGTFETPLSSSAPSNNAPNDVADAPNEAVPVFCVRVRVAVNAKLPKGLKKQ